MSFWEIVGKGITSALNYAEDACVKYQSDIKRYKNKYRYYDDDELYRAYLRTSGVEKNVCADILKKRKAGEDTDEYYGDYEDEELGGY